MAEMLRKFLLTISDTTRDVYDSFELRVAQHPSETDRSLVTRVLARALEHADGVQMSSGVSAGDEPALARRDPTGQLIGWIDIGHPSPERLHKATKQAERVAVYGWHRMAELAESLVTASVFRVEDIALFNMDVAFLDQLVATLDRNNTWQISRSDDDLYLDINGVALSTQLAQVHVEPTRRR
jgi:uncharacterized protein YaeQ